MRLLLLGKGAVLAHGSTVRSLPGWTIRSSAARGPQQRNRAIAMRQLEWFDAGADLRRISIPVSEVLVQSD